jgi:hypothetical protein
VVSRLFHRAWAADADPISPGKIVSARRLIVESVRQDGMPLGGLRRKIAETDWAKLIRDIEAKDAAAPLAVYVTPDNDAFWRRLEKDSPYWCMIPHLMIPAQTGIPQIASIAPLRIERICGWGDGILFYGYGREQDRHRSRNLTVEQLCAEAAGVKVSRVYRLASVAEIAKNTVIECAQK